MTNHTDDRTDTETLETLPEVNRPEDFINGGISNDEQGIELQNRDTSSDSLEEAMVVNQCDAIISEMKEIIQKAKELKKKELQRVNERKTHDPESFVEKTAPVDDDSHARDVHKGKVSGFVDDAKDDALLKISNSPFDLGKSKLLLTDKREEQKQILMSLFIEANGIVDLMIREITSIVDFSENNFKTHISKDIEKEIHAIFYDDSANSGAHFNAALRLLKDSLSPIGTINVLNDSTSRINSFVSAVSPSKHKLLSFESKYFGLVVADFKKYQNELSELILNEASTKISDAYQEFKANKDVVTDKRALAKYVGRAKAIWSILNREYNEIMNVTRKNLDKLKRLKVLNDAEINKLELLKTDLKLKLPEQDIANIENYVVSSSNGIFSAKEHLKLFLTPVEFSSNEITIVNLMIKELNSAKTRVSYFAVEYVCNRKIYAISIGAINEKLPIHLIKEDYIKALKLLMNVKTSFEKLISSKKIDIVDSAEQGETFLANLNISISFINKFLNEYILNNKLETLLQ